MSESLDPPSPSRFPALSLPLDHLGAGRGKEDGPSHATRAGGQVATSPGTFEDLRIPADIEPLKVRVLSTVCLVRVGCVLRGVGSCFQVLFHE